MANKFKLRILTPESTAFEAAVEMVDMPGMMGKIAFLNGHMPYITALKDGWLKVRTDEGDRFGLVFGGFVRMIKNEMVLTASGFEWAEGIDMKLAAQELANAERILEEAEDKHKKRLAEIAVRRANVRLEVSSYTIIKGRINNE